MLLFCSTGQSVVFGTLDVTQIQVMSEDIKKFNEVDQRLESRFTSV